MNNILLRFKEQLKVVPETKELNLANSEINDVCLIIFILPFINKYKITLLYLTCNQKVDESAKALSTNTSITQLNLSRNKIRLTGARELLKNTLIMQLDLSYNLVGYWGKYYQ